MADEVIPEGTSIGVLGSGQHDIVCRHTRIDADIEGVIREVEEALCVCADYVGPIAVVHGPYLGMADFGRLVDAGAHVIFDQKVGSEQPTNDKELVMALRGWFSSIEPTAAICFDDLVPRPGTASVPVERCRTSHAAEPDNEDWPGADDPEFYEEFYKRCAAFGHQRLDKASG